MVIFHFHDGKSSSYLANTMPIGVKSSSSQEQGTTEEAPTPLMLAVTAEPNNKAEQTRQTRQKLG